MGRKPIGKRLSITVHPDLMDQIEHIADREKRSLSQTISILVEKGIEALRQEQNKVI
jgi:metal-responsive CopG/Arc/MetJ family transcriptional regulator